MNRTSIRRTHREVEMAAALALARNVEILAPVRARTVLHEVTRRPVAWPACKLPEFCLAEGLDAQTLRQIEALMNSRIRLRKGETLFRAGDRFTSLYAIRSGSCKTVLLTEDGHDQVAGYHMSGEVIGTGGIGAGSHGCQAVALEDTEVCVLPFERLEALSRQDDRFQRNLYRLLSREIARECNLMLLLGTMRAEQRLAAFLLDLSQRYQVRGYSSCEFILRMTREEIGSYLGLKLETVSRLFSRFQREGLLQVEGRVVKLLDRASVTRLTRWD
jgi:CRP/FNR family transcriptional regulator, anaerobic regulatory protein